MNIPYTHAFIDGEFVKNASSYYETYSPCDGEQICRVMECGQEHLDRAVDAARRALPVWNGYSAEKKADLMRAVAAAIRKRADQIGGLETLDSGIPVSTTKGHFANRSAAFFDYFSGMPDKLHGRVIPVDPGFMTYTKHEPLGVVAILLPWNAPFPELCLAVSAALACGNAAVVKPASDTSLTALIFGEIALEAGLPAGLVNIVTGRGSTVGKALTLQKIDKISFTGGLEVGRGILRDVADRVIPCTMELGGKTPAIVFEDADLATAAAQISFSSVRNTGQICTAASRLYVQRSVYRDFVEQVVEGIKAKKVGNPFEPDTVLGPVVSARHRENILSYMKQGRETGTALLEGGAPDRPGYYVNPAVFADLPHTSRLVQEEIFGPVLCVFPFDTPGQALELANGVSYGLGSSVWTGSIKTSQFFADKLDCGLVWINCINLSHPAVTHGGMKESGVGLQNGMDAALYCYTRHKTVWVNKSI